MSSLHAIPAGVDVLGARAAEMAGHAFGRLSRHPESSAVTLQVLVSRVAALVAKLVPPDPDAEPDPLRTIAGLLPGQLAAGLSLSLDAPWKAMTALVPALLAAEAALHALDATAAVAGPGVLERMAVQVEVDGNVHRHPETFWEALEALVVRALAAESRVAKLPAPKVPTPKVPA